MKIMWNKSNIIIIIQYQGWTSPLSRSRPSGTLDRQGGQTRLWMLKENIYWLPANIFLVLKTGRSNWTNQPIWLLGFRIVEIQEKYSAVEDQTACCYMFVEGNPAPTFKFYKVTFLNEKDIFEPPLPIHFWAIVYLQNQNLLPPVDINISNYVIFKGPRVWCLTKFSLSNLQWYFMLFAVHSNVQYLPQLLILCFFKGVVEDVSTN